MRLTRRTCLIPLAGLVLTLICMCTAVFGERPSVRFTFREPAPTAYWVELPPVPKAQPAPPILSLAATREDSAASTVQFSTRLVLHLTATARLADYLANRPLNLLRTVAPGLHLLAAPDAWTALREAQRLAQLPEVLAAHPDATRPRQTNGAYFRKPSDPYFPSQWHLENRDEGGTSRGVDLNIRAAWPHARGRGVIIGIADDGIEFTHPDLAPNLAPSNHFNFSLNQPGGPHTSDAAHHGTSVAGLAAAVGENGIGVSGVAPEARLASWIVLEPAASDSQFAAMFQYQSNLVAVQNHSWGFSFDGLISPSLLESTALSNAFHFGRSGLGVIRVHAAGNARGKSRGDNQFGTTDVNEDAYTSDPRAITVAAVRSSGRVTSYSNPGACILVAAPSGDGGNLLFTTDRAGLLGSHRILTTNDLSSYTAGGGGFSGTSGSAPQIAGLAALLLSANPALAVRDVQQILVLSSRQTDPTDPANRTNAAGLVVSHNTGFGVPDAGIAVQLARTWSNRPPALTVTLTSTNQLPIPDAGFIVVATGAGVPSSLAAIPAMIPGESFHPDNAPGAELHTGSPTADFPVVFAGLATNSITTNLTNSAALLVRGVAFFSDKIQRAEAAGARLTLIHNTNDNLFSMAVEGFFPRYPAALIGNTAGTALLAQSQTNTSLRVRLQENPATVSFTVTNQLLCEHVSIRVQASHPRRGHLRISLVSPHGTRSVLQRVNPASTDSGPADWTYHSNQHFFEAATGTWQLHVSDELPGTNGVLLAASLILRGVPLLDTDADGLDDRWEMNHFGSLQFGPKGDPDQDGLSNLREQLLNSDPTAANSPHPLLLDLSLWNQNLVRLSWPAAPNRTNILLSGDIITGQLSPVTNIVTRFPETELFLPHTNFLHRFFRLQQPAPP